MRVLSVLLLSLFIQAATIMKREPTESLMDPSFSAGRRSQETVFNLFTNQTLLICADSPPSEMFLILRKNEIKVFATDNQTEQAYEVRNRADFQIHDVGKLMKNVGNIFRLSQTGEIVYYDEDLHQWYLHQFKKLSEEERWQSGTRVAVTWCFDNTNSGDGYVAPTFETQLAASAGTGITGSLQGIFNIQGTVLLLAFGSSLANSVTFMGSYTCNVKAGQYCQFFLRPYYYEVPKGRRVHVKYQKGKGLVEQAKWENTPSFHTYWIGQPIPECAISTSPSICAGIRTRLGI